MTRTCKVRDNLLSKIEELEKERGAALSHGADIAGVSRQIQAQHNALEVHARHCPICSTQRAYRQTKGD